MQPATPPASAFLPPAPLSRAPSRHPVIRAPRRRGVAAVAARLGQSVSAAHAPPHPVLALLAARLASPSSRPGARAPGDDARLALCIEGGGMRGAVGAGMVAAIRYIGLHDAFDGVFGTSAGAVVGAYFCAGQVPVSGARIYYDALCAPERRFIDLRRLRHHPYLRRRGRGRATRDDPTRTADPLCYGPDRLPVLHLDALVDDVLATDYPLDWPVFAARQTVQPLHAVATSLRRLRPVALTDFASRAALSDALRASARVPGIAGAPVAFADGPLADGLLVEAIPYRSARAAGYTHALALCTRAPRPPPRRRRPAVATPRPTSSRAAARPGLYELVVARPHLLGAPGLSEDERAALWKHVSGGAHHATYAADVARIVAGNARARLDTGFEVFGVSPRAGGAYVGQLETRARRVFDGVRSGFEAAYDALSPFAADAGAGARVARLVFPDSEIEEVEARHRAGRRRGRRRSDDRDRVDRSAPEVAEVDLNTMAERYLVG